MSQYEFFSKVLLTYYSQMLVKKVLSIIPPSHFHCTVHDTSYSSY